MKLLSKAQAAVLLGVTVRTICNRMKSGQYKFTKDADTAINGLKNNGRVWFTYEALGLVDPATVPAPAPAPAPVVQPATADNVSAHPLTDSERQEQADRRFAEAYKAGEVPDSVGNYVDGTNDRFPTQGIQSLIGPQAPRPKVREDCTAHMNPALLGTSRPMIGTDGELVYDAGSDNHPLIAARIARGEFRGAPKSCHPNQTRQELLNAIWADVRRGYSR